MACRDRRNLRACIHSGVAMAAAAGCCALAAVSARNRIACPFGQKKSARTLQAIGRAFRGRNRGEGRGISHDARLTLATSVVSLSSNPYPTTAKLPKAEADLACRAFLCPQSPKITKKGFDFQFSEICFQICLESLAFREP